MNDLIQIKPLLLAGFLSQQLFLRISENELFPNVSSQIFLASECLITSSLKVYRKDQNWNIST